MRPATAGALIATAMVIFGQSVAGGTVRPDWHWLVICEGPDAAAERSAIVSALRLLPRLPARVAVIDAREAKPDVQPALMKLDAFIIRGSAVVYLLRQSMLLRGARAGSAAHTHALAAAIWHEIAHVEGADERQARQREQALWTVFVRDQRVETVAALRYLKALESRPDDQLLALR